MNKQEQSEQRRIKELNMSNEDIFKVIHEDELVRNLNENSSRPGSVNAMRYLEFGFGLGYNQDGEISFNAYCLDKEGWSNCCNFKPTSICWAFDFIGFWNSEFEDNKNEIIELLKKHKNKLFLCKERSKTELFKEGALTWSFFPEAPSIRNEMQIEYQEDLDIVKKLIGDIKC